MNRARDEIITYARRLADQRYAISNTEDGAKRAVRLIEERNAMILELVKEIEK